MDKQLLRVLIVDESPDDAERATDLLRKAGHILKTQRVQDASGLKAELAKWQWDLVISEFQLNHLKGAQALDAVRRTDQDTPFIILTRRISDDEIAKIMRAGAQDVVIKDQAARLAPVVERELAAREARAALKSAQDNLRELEEKHRSLVGTSREAICYSHDGMHVDANRAYLTLFGYEDLSELEGVPFLNLVDRADHRQIKEHFRKNGGSGEPLSFTAVNQQGQQFPAEISISSITIKGEQCQQIVVSDISKRKAAEQRLLYLSQRDGLTGLYNRYYFLQELGKQIEQARTNNTRATLLSVDVDELGDINHEFGLEAGDRLQLKVGKLLREKLREEDIVARLSGDKFAALMPGVTRTSAQALADDVAKSLAATPIEENGKSRPCSCHVTITEIDAQTASVQQVLKDAAPTQAKPKARAETAAPAPTSKTPSPSVASPAPKAETGGSATATAKTAWTQRITSALAEGRVNLVFQPIVSLHAEPAECYEVLVRINEESGEIAAGEFMAAAEESRQAQRIDRLVVQQTMDKLAILLPRGKRTRFFINVSLCTLRDPEFLGFLEERLTTTGVNGRYLVFEIDESAIAKQPKELEHFIGTVKRLGCRLAIDDFTPSRGPYVHQQPITYLKISGAVVRALANDPNAQATVRAISGMAKTLGKRVVAKSVESAESLSTLWRYEIDYVQGHYFQTPAAQLGYDFNIESISSDEAVSSWAPTR